MIIKTKKKFRFFGEESHKIVDYRAKGKLDINLDHLSKKVKKMKSVSLGIDGGGILGVLALYSMTNSEQKSKLGIKFNSLVKDYYGTSTGAIIVACMCIGIRVQEILRMYVEDGGKMFNDKSGFLKVFSAHRYKADWLEKKFNEIFGNITFSQLKKKSKKNLTIYAVNQYSRNTMYLNAKNTPNMPIKVALRMSSSAPTYFPPKIYKSIIGLDGGTGTFNCAVDKQIDNALFRKKLKTRQFQVISFGTGSTPDIIPYTQAPEKFIKKYAKAGKLKMLLWTVMFGRDESVKKQIRRAKHLIKSIKLNFVRVDPLLPKEFDKMDETNNIDELIGMLDNPKKGK